ncbi:MAG TPA: M24 family metallopeptidase [Phycisphaerales bacterium]|nr:M24 family metallopeptidase [Phycisphaerales bacterium]
MRLDDLQTYMHDQRIGGWLIWDFRGSNSTLARLLPLPKGHPTGRRHLTRRAALWIPARGEPVLLSHGIDSVAFHDAALIGGGKVKTDLYLTWQQLWAWVNARVGESGGRVAMEYAAGGALPVVSVVDAGTVEMVRSCGAEVVSSANLIQVCIARWSAAALESHEWASKEVARIKDSAFDLIRTRLAANQRVTEWDVHQHIHTLFKQANLETPDGPIVAANAHGADPHFEVSETSPAEIKRGDFILLDLWARRPGDEHIFSDITWVAWAASMPGAPVPERHRKVFEAVKAGRDAAVALAQARWNAKQPVQGWELDDAARTVIEKAGYGQYIKHRTGHSLSAGPMVHGVGVNIDNLETHDTRELLPGVGFTVEPGVYIPDGPDGPGFGVRLEINVYADPTAGPRVTSCIQNEIVIV